MKRLKMVVITQDDQFAIPKNIELLLGADFIEFIRCILVEDKNSMTGRKWYFASGFGFRQAFHMALKVIVYRAFDMIFTITGSRHLSRFRRIRTICRVSNTCVQKTDDVNSSLFCREMSQLRPDIIVSFSAPVIFENELLSIPKYGCINLHCSLLPKYAGIMPSFWTLLNGEATTGCSIHTMDSLIDNGALISQCPITIEENDTMYDVILRTKSVGGVLMLDTLRFLFIHKRFQNSINVDDSERTYNGWPNRDDFSEFRAMGKRLV